MSYGVRLWWWWGGDTPIVVTAATVMTVMVARIRLDWHAPVGGSGLWLSPIQMPSAVYAALGPSRGWVVYNDCPR